MMSNEKSCEVVVDSTEDENPKLYCYNDLTTFSIIPSGDKCGKSRIWSPYRQKCVRLFRPTHVVMERTTTTNIELLDETTVVTVDVEDTTTIQPDLMYDESPDNV